jgi:hypothetical protein
MAFFKKKLQKNRSFFPEEILLRNLFQWSRHVLLITGKIVTIFSLLFPDCIRPFPKRIKVVWCNIAKRPC